MHYHVRILAHRDGPTSRVTWVELPNRPNLEETIVIGPGRFKIVDLVHIPSDNRIELHVVQSSYVRGVGWEHG